MTMACILWRREEVIVNSSIRRSWAGSRLQASQAMTSRPERSTAFSSKLVSGSEEYMRYAIVIERAESNYSAYVPDLPGCIATAATVEETERLIREAIDMHLTGLRQDGLPIPQPSSQVEYVEVAV
jgi:predicted RNase H-like HicB family nuclease